MTSPVDTSVKFFRSTMPGAPVLTGTAGSLIALLDACLVNGWGSQTATSVVVSAGVATATFPSNHAAAVDSVVLVAGATSLTDLNGEQKVTAVAPNVIKWNTAAANGTATGTITVKMAGAGWNKSFSGTNLAAYKSASVQAHGQFLRIDDSNANYARLIGYENMTAISTGTGLFPTAAQLSGGMYWGKSLAADTTPVPWAIVSDGRGFYFNAASYAPLGGASYMSGSAYFFGDLIPLSKAPDPYATVLTGSTASGWDNYALSELYRAGTNDYRYSPRTFDGLGTAFKPDTGPYCTTDPGPLPNKVNGRLPLTSIFMRDGASQTHFRADFPGANYVMSTGVENVLPANSVFIDETGRSRIALLGGNNVYTLSSLNAMAVDVTGPWR